MFSEILGRTISPRGEGAGTFLQVTCYIKI